VSADHRAAAVALTAGDPITALKLAGTGEDPHALAIRGVAMAQLGELDKARRLLESAAALFDRDGERLFRARALVALAEVIAAERDLDSAQAALAEALARLESVGDHRNAAWARLVIARLYILQGDLARAREVMSAIDLRAASPSARVVVHLARAEASMRELKATEAASAVARARSSAERSKNPVLIAEVERVEASLSEPIARAFDEHEPLTLSAVERALAKRVVVDGLGRRLRFRDQVVDLRRRPVLYALLAELARALPEGASGERLIRTAFAARAPNESHRARLRVEIGRLRRAIQGHVEVSAVAGAWRIRARSGERIQLIEPLGDPRFAPIEALLSDGAAWSAKSLARALGQGERTVQRSLLDLAQRGAVEPIGSARARRYALRSRGDRIASQMLLLGVADPR
jgi:hypothetical protein